MQTKSFKQWTILPCSPDVAYHAWLDSKEHGWMIDGSAKIDPKVGGKFSIWDGSVVGKTVALDPKTNKITQEWRYEYDDWPKDAFSKITVQFVAHKDGQCKLRFWHSGVPEKYADDIAKGWQEYYWKPMKEYFEKRK